MTVHPIKLAFDKLEPSIKLIAKDFPEGRNILIRCLSRNARRTETETIEWLKSHDIPIKDIDLYKINDNDKD